MEDSSTISIASIIGFFVIVFVVGYLLHRLLSKTSIYKKKVKSKGYFAKLLYAIIVLIALYIVLLVIFGIVKLIHF